MRKQNSKFKNTREFRLNILAGDDSPNYFARVKRSIRPDEEMSSVEDDKPVNNDEDDETSQSLTWTKSFKRRSLRRSSRRNKSKRSTQKEDGEAEPELVENENMHKFYVTRLKHSLIISFLILIPVQNFFFIVVSLFSKQGLFPRLLDTVTFFCLFFYSQ